MYIIHHPDALMAPDNFEAIKNHIVTLNLDLLLGASVYKDMTTEDLIGDPYYGLSATVCDLLTGCGVLGQNTDGSYVWLKSLAEGCSWEQLEAVAWDLRHHCHFAHVSVLSQDETVFDALEEEEDTVAIPEESEDSFEPEVAGATCTFHDECGRLGCPNCQD